MDVISQIKRMAGQGVRLEIKPPHTYFLPGHPVWFEATIVAAQAISIRSVVGELIGSESASKRLAGQEQAADLQFEVAHDLALAAGETLSLTAEIPLPREIPPTSSDEQQRQEWMLRVTLDVPNAIDVVATTPIIIAPAIACGWETEVSITAKSETRAAFAWEASGSFIIAQPDGTDPDVLTSLVTRELIDAFEEYLNSTPELASRRHEAGDEAVRKEVAGALGEIVGPRVRAAEALELDYVASVTVDHLSYTPAG
ncbi:MAG TPA: hypothetical protein VER55_11980 [Ardenticatenaceae bacterium]|nr:hypothetical protein [Ardenticatenaceae bacterium]